MNGRIAVTEEQRKLSEDEANDRRRRMRSIAIAVSLFILVVLFYLATIVHLGPNALNRPI